MYNQKMVATIKVKGKILREFKDTIYIKFGSEYSILLKNLSTVRSIVNVFIDGDNIVPGGLVLGPGQEVDLERSIKNGNLTTGNKLKFIERTSAIEDGPRGLKAEDGLIRVEYQFEKVYKQITSDWDYLTKQKQQWPSQAPWYGQFFGSIDRGTAGDRFSITAQGVVNQVNVNGALRGIDTSANGAAMQASASAAFDHYCKTQGIQNKMEFHDGAATMDWNDTGITVPGSKSDQKFQTASWFPTETEKHSIILKLLGETPNNKPVQESVTVKQKQKCDTCGTMNKATAHFCSKCGTSLVLYA